MKRKELMKRLFCMCLTAGMVFGLTACGSSNDATAAYAPQAIQGFTDSKNNASFSTSPTNEGAVMADTAIYEEYEMVEACAAEEEGDYYIDQQFNTEEYNTITENRFVNVATNPFSTFAIDVDTGSYTNFRRMVKQNYGAEDIPGGAIRIEEMINYFDYEVNNKSDGKFSVQSEIHECPWNDEHELLLLTVQANEVDVENEGNNFVYLIDTSGSMGSQGKMDLVKESFKLLTQSLDDKDTISIVTYAGNFDTLIEGCPAKNYKKIEKIIDGLSTGGGTNGSGGIEAAYDVALKNYVEGGNNRVIIASDGDMNLGVTSQAGLVDLIKEKKDAGVFLTTLGYGDGNYSDANMEQIADAGNGNYYYIDCIAEAERVLVDKLKETTITVAKDVKIQVEFNPVEVKSYRLIGYENRVMAADDFKDDTVDGGEVGAGQQVTVLYEISKDETDNAPESKYQKTEEIESREHVAKGELLNVAIRYKEVDADKSVQEDYAVMRENTDISEDFYFAAAVANASMVLRNSDFVNDATMDDAYELAKKGDKDDDLREEFARMIKNLR